MKVTSVFFALIGAQTIAAAPLEPIVSVNDDITLVPRDPQASIRGKTRLMIEQSDSTTVDPAAGLYSKNITTRELDERAAKNVVYSSNWAGAILNNGNGQFKTVQATIKVPKPQVPRGGNSKTQYGASAWVGLDGDSCQSAILQTGITMYIQNGQVRFDAWYEWYPDYAYNFQGFAVRVGDTIRMTVTANTDKKSGIATLENLTTRKSVSHSFKNQAAALCLQDAEFIVEDFQSNGALVPFINFVNVGFNNAVVRNFKNKLTSLVGSKLVNIRQNNKVLTVCGTTANAANCRYVG